jgi:hypothetical protein
MGDDDLLLLHNFVLSFQSLSFPFLSFLINKNKKETTTGTHFCFSSFVLKTHGIHVTVPLEKLRTTERRRE